ncbi:hypothetical protein [Lichenibacterium dinghuense]|uniref:hypothetical protein n=1 Tax=Lichenibacterium dinghuense TaxID=2895977 RepID=UPI001F348BDA|nr:hypothetical protein [Lichenibacterium sp. 6Y81]
MRRMKLGLALGLLGGVAMGGAAWAQTPPAPRPPAAAQAPTPPAPAPAAPQPPSAPQGPAGAQANTPNIPAPSGPPEGMIVETPNGFYLVRPGEGAPQKLDLGRNGAPGQPGANPGGMAQGPMAGGGDAMDDMADDGMQPPPPHPHRPPPHPPEGKGARIHIHTPNLDVNVKCPDDEPIKACVDAISQLMDKANAQPH